VRGYTAIGYIKVGSSKGPDTKHGFRGAGEEALQPLSTWMRLAVARARDAERRADAIGRCAWRLGARPSQT